MKCPSCQENLSKEQYHEIEIERCSQCRGLWLDLHELDTLEDTELDVDSAKGTLKFSDRDSGRKCVKCQKLMKSFNYRAYDLVIEVCPDTHGYWLDAGEEMRVQELMQQRIKDLNRKAKAEAEWSSFTANLSSKSLLGKIKNLLLKL